MAQDDSPAPDVTADGFPERQRDVVLVPVDPNESTGPEAVRILRKSGVQAWREWVANHADGS